jgi:hypothetical protein
LPKPFQKHQWQKPWHLEDFFANEIAIQPLPVPMSRIKSLNFSIFELFLITTNSSVSGLESRHLD